VGVASAGERGVDALLGGATVSAVMREWQRRGLPSPQNHGRPWTRNSVTTIMKNPALAGLRAYHGEIIGRGDWEPVLDEQTWRAVDSLLRDPSRVPPRGVRTLGGGLFRCRCGNTLQGSVNATGKHVYRCNPQTRGDRPGPHCQQMIAAVDDYVEQVITGRLSRPDVAELAAPKRPDLTHLHREAAPIRRNLDELAADRAVGLISRAQMLAATERANARLEEISAELAAAASGSVLAPFVGGQAARAVWEALDSSRKRAVIDALCTVVVHPAGRGAREFNPDTVEIQWRQS
jgi:hypothetical protein